MEVGQSHGETCAHTHTYTHTWSVVCICSYLFTTVSGRECTCICCRADIATGPTLGKPENNTVAPDRVPPVITVLGKGTRALLATGEAVMYDTVMFR